MGVQSTTENPERDVQSGEGIFPILVGGPPEFAWPYSAANRGRTTNAIQLPTGRIDVTRNRQIDHKERTVAAIHMLQARKTVCWRGPNSQLTG